MFSECRVTLIHTIELVERGRDGFDACLAAERNGESSFERWNHDCEMCVEVIGKRLIWVRLSKVIVAMFMSEMVGWFVIIMRAQASPMLAISLLHLTSAGLGSPNLATESAAQPFAIGQYRHHHTTAQHRNTTARQQSRDKYYTPSTTPTHRILRPTGQTSHRRHVAIRRTGTSHHPPPSPNQPF